MMVSRIETILVRIFVIGVVIPIILLILAILTVFNKEDWIIKKFPGYFNTY